MAKRNGQDSTAQPDTADQETEEVTETAQNTGHGDEPIASIGTLETPKVVTPPTGGKSSYITRQQMVDTILINKGSVLHKGRLITNAADLPSEAELAAESGNTSEIEKAQADNVATIKRLTLENERLVAAGKRAKTATMPR